MTGKNTKSQKTSAIAQFYLRSYNLVQVLGWCFILYEYLCYYTGFISETSLWDTVKVAVIVFQNAAVLEIIHAATGLVPSNPMITTFQVFSRVMIVCGVLLATPYSFAASSLGLPLAILAWSIAEIIRYSYYFMSLIGLVPYFLTWLRYTGFIILYPVGITGELLCLYAAKNYAISNPEAWSYTLPNKWNFTFNYNYLLLIVMLLYIPLFPQMYRHMLVQRRKILGSSSGSRSKKVK